MQWKKYLKIPESKYSIRTICTWLWRAWRGNRLQAAINALIGLLSVAVSLAQVWAVKHAVDVASGADEGSIYGAVAVMGLLVLCSFGLHIAGIWVHNILGIRAQNNMQQQMLDRILRSEWRGRESLHSGDMLNRLEFDVKNVVNFLTETLPGMLSVIAMFAGAFFYLFYMDRLLAVITIAVIPLFLGVSRIYVKKMRQLTYKVRSSDSKVQSVLQESIQHRVLIKTMESDAEMVDKLGNTQTELQHHVINRTKFSLFSNVAINLGFSIGYLIAFLWAAIRMSQSTLTFGGMTAFLQLVNKVQSPARNMMKLVPEFVGVLTAAERLMELEENPLEEQGTPVRMASPCGIKLHDVSYSYAADSRQIINHLDFDFKPGTCTAILGETGAGKTTLIRMLLSLIHPRQGKIEIYNGRISHELSPRMRCNFDYVPQGNTLMSGTIRDNLLLGNLQASEDDIREALRISCAEFVYTLPQGLDTFCTEHGGGLSEGQAQRISIARALLRNRPIMLFDEATSALDVETEEQMLKNILSIKDKTMIFITHRPAIVAYCDQVLKIERT